MATKGSKNQLSRYGAIAKDTPFVTGKVFFLVSATEQAFNFFQDSFPPDDDGLIRVYTTWAALITALQSVVNVNQGQPAVFVSPQYTTVPTQAQINTMNNLQVQVIQAAQLTPEGSYITANLNPVNQATTTTENLFQVNGRIKMYGMFGQVITTIGGTVATGQTTKLQIVPTVGSTVSLCSASTTGGATVGTQLALNGAALSNALIVTTSGAFIAADIGTPITVQAGILQAITGATTTGNIAWTINYAPIDPGAFVIPLQ